jgi:hypothetical protein
MNRDGADWVNLKATASMLGQVILQAASSLSANGFIQQV